METVFLNMMSQRAIERYVLNH